MVVKLLSGAKMTDQGCYGELADHINKVWADTYPGAVDATTMIALKNRVKNLAEDRNCWVFNAKVLQNKLVALDKK